MIRRISPALALIGVGVLSALLLYATGRPLFTDDTWWHLAHGEAYFTQGPWLDEDPLLFAAPGPPMPASWLFDLGLYGIWQMAGFAGLRLFHVLIVATILGLGFRHLRRVSGSGEFAALGTGLFIVLGAFRLFQLRPELTSIFATFVLYGALLSVGGSKGMLRTCGTAFALAAVWANLHAGFLLGPILLFAAAIGLSAALVVHPSRAALFGGAERIQRLAAAGGAALIGSLLNPSGFEALLPYLRSGEATPDLTVVYDEWRPLELFQLPLREISPAPIDWVILWILLLTTVGAVLWWVLGARKSESAARQLDPALIALACASWLAMAISVRFLWMAILPLLLLGQIARLRLATSDRSTLRISALCALLVALLIPAFAQLGMWPFISRGIPGTVDRFLEPYAIGKHPGHAAWFLADTGIRGNLYAPYPSGGFLGFWLAPDIRALANGSLNLRPAAMSTYSALQQRQGRGDSTFEETLAELEIDVFLGAGLAGYHPTRPRPFTTTHLERSSGWIQVFRNLRSSVWLRDSPRNEENFDRVRTYYSNAGLSFDRSAGFTVDRALREAPGWSRRNGLVPTDFPSLERAAMAREARGHERALSRLAGIRAGLGQYGEALEIDRRLDALGAPQPERLQRQLWCLIHLDRPAEALGVAAELEAGPGKNLSARFALAARQYAEEPDAARRTALSATLPLLSRSQASQLIRGFAPPKIRSQRERSPSEAQP